MALKVLAMAMRRERKKRNPDLKRSKTLTFANDMILHIENPKETIF